ncbi:MAG TPA: TIGR02301 family protein [Methylocella sp.]|nr:TIGR02301 family protein [Methylocella sp.]
MKEALVFAGAGNIPGQALRAIAAAAICVAISTASAASPFDFLFGGPPAATPPPAQAKPGQSGGNNPQHGKAKHKAKPKAAIAAKPATGAKTAPAPEAEPPPPPYDPEIQRLAEILGALTYLDALCASNPPGDWRAKMQALLEAEAKTAARKQRLAGSYNRGFQDYERTYHLCTPNAQAIIGRFLAEGGKIAHEVVNRYGAS